MDSGIQERGELYEIRIIAFTEYKARIKVLTGPYAGEDIWIDRQKFMKMFRHREGEK